MSIEPVPSLTLTRGHALLESWLSTTAPGESMHQRLDWLREQVNARPGAGIRRLAATSTLYDWIETGRKEDRRRAPPGFRWRVVLADLTAGAVPVAAWEVAP